MAKLLLLMGLIPVFISFIARKFLSDRIVRKEGGFEMSISGHEMIEKISVRVRLRVGILVTGVWSISK